MLVANVRPSRGAWVDAALQALAAGGPDAVRVFADRRVIENVRCHKFVDDM